MDELDPVAKLSAWHLWACCVPVTVHLDELLARRRMTLTELAGRVGITVANLERELGFRLRTYTGWKRHAEELTLTSDRPDSDLIARSRTEPAMFAEIFDRHHGELYRYLRRRVGAELAADLAAETFVTAFARRCAYRPEGTNARPWLYGIAHNLLRNHLRHEQRQLAAHARHGAQPAADAAALAEFSLADARADAAAVSARLTQILLGLPAGDRDVLLLFAWADLSYAEVAQALNIPVGTVRSRLNRARRQMRVLVENEALDTRLEENHG